jgi:hypothetical protein
MNELTEYKKLIKLISLFQRISQLSWSVDQTKKRYPSPEAMTNTEIGQLNMVFTALGSEIEQIYIAWKELVKDEQRD